MNIYIVNAYVPGVGHIGLTVGAQDQVAAQNSVAAMYANARIKSVVKIAGK